MRVSVPVPEIGIDKAVWSRDAERGHIQGVTFKDIRATGDRPRVDLKGFDEGHRVEDVTFENVIINGAPLATASVEADAFVSRVVVRP